MKFQIIYFAKVSEQEGKIWISNGASYALISIIPEKMRLAEVTPISLLKALKNNVEIQGINLI